MKTQAFVYHWQELSTNKWYIGSHSRKGCHPNNGYITSSKLVKSLIQSNPNDWKRTIIAMSDPKDIVKFEIVLLKALDAKNDPMSYNQHNGDGIVLNTGIPHTIIHRNRIRKALLGQKHTDERRKNISASVKGRIPWNKDKPHTETTRKKISDANKGKCYLTEQGRLKIKSAKRGSHNSNPGIKNGRALLTESQVLDIRTQQLTIEEYANKYKVKPVTVYKIQKRKLWKHI